MSRVGKIPVAIPQGVKAQVSGSLVKVEGPKGKLERQLSPGIKAEVADGKITIVRSSDEKQQRMLQGLERALVNNMVVGVSQGYAKELDLIGVGYRADIKGQVLTLGLGYSHTIDFELPAGIKGSVIKEGRDITVRVEGIDRQLVGQVAANIRSLREPEPYKGKGVRYKGEVIKLKAGKAGKK